MKPQQASTTAKLIAAGLVLLASDPRTRGLVAPEAAAFSERCLSGADRWLAGSVEDVVERIAELRELGVTRVFLQHLNHADDEMVALLGERLLPALR